MVWRIQSLLILAILLASCEGVNSTLLFGFASSVFANLCLSLLNPFTARALDGDFKVTVTFESADQILWCDHSNESSLPVLTHGAICFSTFHKVKFGNLLSVKFVSERANREKKSRGITITIIVITVTTSLSLSQPWSFFSSPPLKSLSFHHLCSPYRYETGGWPAWGYANSRRISDRRFSPSENRVCEPER